MDVNVIDEPQTKRIQKPTPGRVVLWAAPQHDKEDLPRPYRDCALACIVQRYTDGGYCLLSRPDGRPVVAKYGAYPDGKPLEGCWAYPPRSDETIDVPAPSRR